MKAKPREPSSKHKRKPISKPESEQGHWRPETPEDRDALIRLGGEGGIAYDDDAQVG